MIDLLITLVLPMCIIGLVIFVALLALGLLGVNSLINRDEG